MPDLPDDAYLMVTQQHWEDKVMFDVPYTPSPQFSGLGGIWKPLNEASSSSRGQLGGAGRTSAEGASNGGLGNGSLFPIDNYELAYHRWEDDVILDSEAMDHIPRPSLAQIDPNDGNFVIGIPEEPPPPPPAPLPGYKDTRKVIILL